MSKKAAVEKHRPVAPPVDASAPPAYFLSINVTNFRCFADEQTLDLSDDSGKPAMWTVILGDNGVGKTTLLQATAAMEQVVTSEPGWPNFITSKITSHRKIGPFWDKLTSSDNGSLQMVISAKTLVADAGEISVQHSQFKQSFSQASYTPANLNFNGPRCYGFGASRRPSRTALSENAQDHCATLFDDTAELINAEEWLLQADYAKEKGQQQAAKRLERVKTILMRLLPDVEDFKFEHLSERTYLPVVQALTSYGWVPVRSLSLGYQSLITWTVDLASRLFERYPESENPFAEPAVVLVDEIDLHLHPKWQRTLMQTLSETFPKTQFIVTAHSPLVVQSDPNANIVVLRREGDHVVIDNNVKIVEGWRADQLLTSDLFGLPSARPPHLDKLIEERDNILSKSHLTDADQERLKELGRKIGNLPTGESSADIEAMDIIRRAAKLLSERTSNSK